MPQYILLPREGLRATETASVETFSRIENAKTETRGPDFAEIEGVPVSVLDSIDAGGPKLVEIDEDAAGRLRDNRDYRLVPLVTYERATQDLRIASLAPRPLSGTQQIFNVADQSGNGIAGVDVIGLSEDANAVGDKGTTDSRGDVALNFGAGVSTLESVYVIPKRDQYWGRFVSNVPLSRQPIGFRLDPIDLSHIDGVRHFYAGSTFDESTGVKVGVIDDGVYQHQSLNLTGGANTVLGESRDDYFNCDSVGHGTHVAGVIGAYGNPPAGVRGVAPNVELRSYRVFGASGGDASNFAIVKALVIAQLEKCDIVNLSFRGTEEDEVVRDAVIDAVNHGVLVIASAGNDGRGAVGYPARYPNAIAVSAAGREELLLPGSIQRAEVDSPRGNDSDDFVAKFSNVGYEIEMTGPGVGVLSTLPDQSHGPMNGTSVSAPAVSGFAACLLSQNRDVFDLARNRTRTDALSSLLRSSCSKFGFGTTYEGLGQPRC
ncbi:MAG: S8 family serine peptidase [Planctomycetota bacterium]